MQNYLDFLRAPLTASEQNEAKALRVEYDRIASELNEEKLHSDSLQPFTLVFSQTLRDHEESLKKWQDAQNFICDRVGQNLAPSLHDLAILHRLVGGDGEIRPHDSYAGRNTFLPAKWISNMMEHFEKEVLSANLETFEKSARAYQWIKCIHPFADGNGRVASLVRDWILALDGFLPVAGLSSDDAYVDIFPEQSRSGAAVLQVLRGSILTADILKNGSKEVLQSLNREAI